MSLSVNESVSERVKEKVTFRDGLKGTKELEFRSVKDCRIFYLSRFRGKGGG